MIKSDFSLLVSKIGSIQTCLSNLFDFEQFRDPVFEREKKYCKNFVEELDTSQTVLVEKRAHNSCENKNTDIKSSYKSLNSFDKFLPIDLFGNPLEIEDSGCMSKKDRFNELVAEQLKKNFGLEEINENLENSSDYDESNIIIYPDNRFEMIKRICPHCDAVDANVNKWEKRIHKNKKNKPVVYYPKSYICNICNKWFITPVNFNLTKEMKEKIGLDRKIRDIHANSSLSFDKIAEILEITMNVNVSHQYIRNVVQKEHDDFVYETDIIILPSDFKKKGKTSMERGVTDIGLLFMFKKKNMKISGEIEVDELFTDIDGERYYVVNVFANEIKEMPIAVAVVNTRHYDVMKKFFDFIFEDNEFKALTTDKLAVYGKIAENEKAHHQNCIVHWMKSNGKIIFDKIKKEEFSEIESIWLLRLYTEMKEILRSINKKNTENLILNFLDNLSNIPDFMEKIVKKFFENIDSLTKHSIIDKMHRTTSKVENFHSLPQIRHKKHTSKKPFALLLSIASTVKYYKANYRTLKLRP